jgi:hypothetical protein
MATPTVPTGYNIGHYQNAFNIFPSDTAIIPNPQNILGTGNSDGATVAANKLIDNTVNFIKLGVQVGATVYNLQAGTASNVTGVSENELTLEEDIFTVVNQFYGVANNSVISGADAIWTGTGGDINGITKGGLGITIPGVPANTILPISLLRVYATDTTATGMIALFLA